MPRSTFPESLWAGTESTLNLSVEVHDKVLAGDIKAGPMDMPDDDEEDCQPHLLDIQGGVGIINIRGSLKANAAWYDEMFGLCSYEAIRDAVMYAVNSEDVKCILLDINSGGGAVSGCSDVSRLIREVNDKVKPVLAYTDGTMASAAYWLGCSASKVYASETAITGSIGVLMVHTEYSKQFEDEGVGVTVMRSGKEKALVNAYEPLTQKAKSNLQEHLDIAYGIFVNHVAAMRGMTYAVADNAAQGKEYMGVQAVDAGLVDGIKNFDQVMSQCLDIIAKEENNRASFNRGLPNMAGKQALTDQQIAAMAAAAEMGLSASTDTVVTEVENQDGVQEGRGQEEVTAEVAAEVQAEAPAPAADAGVVAFLQASLKEKDEAIVAANVKLAQAQAQIAEVESLKATLKSMSEIVCKSVTNMKIALGQSGVDLTGLSPEVLLAEHKATAEVFVAKLPVGGVAAVDAVASTKVEKTKTEPQVTSVMAAQIRAIRGN